MLLAGTIFIPDPVLVIWQPRGLGDRLERGLWRRGAGAGHRWRTGSRYPGAGVAWHISSGMRPPPLSGNVTHWPSALLLDGLAFFEWAALHVSRWGRGRGRLCCFTRIILTRRGGASAAYNDGAALIRHANRDCHAASAGVQQGNLCLAPLSAAAGFIKPDTASLPLQSGVESEVNIVSWQISLPLRLQGGTLR
ncbi:hypothetical protein LNQ03_22820 [Klebsiella pneumoniae subsp. pneumoniae]|nr:hypothetical protein [Klebsiella pneumoniae subsp. pneumoniae]